MKRSTWRWPWQKPEPPEPVRPPKVGGTRAPDTVHRIDFTKPHDFHFRFGYNKEYFHVFRRCLLIGFTTPVDDRAGERGDFGEFDHNRWLVLQQEDGRLLYVSRDQLVYIEESANSAAERPGN